MELETFVHMRRVCYLVWGLRLLSLSKPTCLIKKRGCGRQRLADVKMNVGRWRMWWAGRTHSSGQGRREGVGKGWELFPAELVGFSADLCVHKERGSGLHSSTQDTQLVRACGWEDPSSWIRLQDENKNPFSKRKRVLAWGQFCSQGLNTYKY